MSVMYEENRNGNGTDYEELASECLDQFDDFEWDSRPVTWNDPFVRLNSGLGSNKGLNSPYTEDGVVLPFDKRYVVIDNYKVAVHSHIYKQSEVRNVVLSWLSRYVLSDFRIDPEPVRNDCIYSYY